MVLCKILFFLRILQEPILGSYEDFHRGIVHVRTATPEYTDREDLSTEEMHNDAMNK